ncbi:hypothetical protein MPRF_53150 [Mycolicibacterium parafortuitum]|uniref:Uncharacterized protein n=1 Tax=Mycolicibacterium parafortuitum TaxID=39692 RepID=A0A7I7UDX6_MYCPF|nr:hypothetical protein MPRF_53150 [Mycolicibacterium parafortuitum]
MARPNPDDAPVTSVEIPSMFMAAFPLVVPDPYLTAALGGGERAVLPGPTRSVAGQTRALGRQVPGRSAQLSAK